MVSFSVNHLHWHLFYLPHILYIQTVRLQQLPAIATKVYLSFEKDKLIKGRKMCLNMKIVKTRTYRYRYMERASVA
jgi:hypothetical protein